MDCGFNLHDTMIWEKTGSGALGSTLCYAQNFEYMFVFSKGIPKTFNAIMIDCKYAGYGTSPRLYDKTGALRGNGKRIIHETKTHNNIFCYTVGNMGNGQIQHPAIFPEQLAKDHILSWSNEGDLVYDPFGGSGTTAKMSHLEKRNWIISEISSEYAALSAKRIDPYLRQMTLF